MSSAVDRSPLGKPSVRATAYDPTLLFPVARALQRASLGITGAAPFAGVDIWTAYEVSWLGARGKPEAAIGTLRVPAHSPNIVESKSMKLYFNAFSETRFDGPAEVAHVLREDLTRVCGEPVTVEFARADRSPHVADLAGESLDALDAAIDHYVPAPELLSTAHGTVEETLVSNLFKSNCPVTGQPDWASVQIRYRGAKIDRAGLLGYIVSFRHHQGFHEHCVEQMFVEIMARCRPEALSVYARFTRRGGIDINPFRSNWEAAPSENVRTPRQ